jgi:hypothetical protein
MAKVKYSALLILFLATLFVAGCKKDDEPEAPSKTDLLTAKAWKLNTISAPPLPDNDPRVMSVIGGLSNSNVKFENNGTYTATNRNTNAVETGTWEFNADQTQIITDKGQSDSFTFTIVNLTANNLDLSTPFSANIGIPVTLTVSLKLIPA